jgi:uncharacterized iron-regulated membrane protein
MTYSGSLAQAGRGSSVLIGSTPTEIGEVTSAAFSGQAWGYVETSNFDSGVDEEFIPTMRDNGTLRIQGNKVDADAGQVLLKADYVVQLPKTATQTTTGTKYTFTAYCQTLTFAVGVKDKIALDATLKITGPIVRVVGS